MIWSQEIWLWSPHSQPVWSVVHLLLRFGFMCLLREHKLIVMHMKNKFSFNYVSYLLIKTHLTFLDTCLYPSSIIYLFTSIIHPFIYLSIYIPMYLLSISITYSSTYICIYHLCIYHLYHLSNHPSIYLCV
jgi:hypothetical protein